MELAIIGSGKIVHDALFAMEPISEIEKVAIYVRPHSLEKGQALAAQYGMKEVYTDYDQLLEKSSADTVYIGLVNSAHYPYAKKALLKGKNVILEKPFTCFMDEAQELMEIAEANKLFVLEAVTILHSPVFGKMKEDKEKLGVIRSFQANYSQYSSRYDNYLKGIIDPSLSPEFYGGALYDINVYNIHYCAGLYGRPNTVQYYPNLGPNGIDTSGTLVMTYDGFSAVCTGSKDSDSPGFVCVQGEKGYMRVNGKPNVAYSLTTIYADPAIKERVKDSAGAMVRATIDEDFVTPDEHHRMTPEFRDFVRIIDGKDYEEGHRIMEESVIVMEILQKARESAGIPFSR